MSEINVEAGDDTPRVFLDEDNGLLIIEGNSTPEDTVKFYQPVLDWLIAYPLSPFPHLTIQFKLNYYNTASSLLLLRVMQRADELVPEGLSVKMEWHYREDDEEMLDAGYMLQEGISQIKIDFIPTK